jgi:deazaflavin-dependent oxidoreductase (nitroreductase family)
MLRNMQPMTATPLTRTRKPRLGGIFMSGARATAGLMLPLAGKRWNPLFSVVRHPGRRTGKTFETPVAARRIADGFVLALAFGSGAHWYQNLVAAGGGTIRWRGVEYPVGAPQRIGVETALSAFNATPGDEDGRYLSESEKEAVMANKGIPANPEPR